MLGMVEILCSRSTTCYNRHTGTRAPSDDLRVVDIGSFAGQNICIVVYYETLLVDEAGMPVSLLSVSSTA